MTTDPRAGTQRRALGAAVLTLEAIVLALSAPVMIHLTPVSVPVALGVALGLAAACLLAAGMLRHEWGYLLGWVIQAWAVALGLLVPAMLALGAIFGLLWWAAYWLGRKIERERAEAYAAHDEAAPEPPNEAH